MARPQKKSDQRREIQLPPIRCTKYEYELISKLSKKSGLTVSAYLRRAAVNQNIAPVGYDWTEVIIHLKRIGVNINQQTRKMHQINTFPDELWELWQKLSGLLDEIILNHNKTG